MTHAELPSARWILLGPDLGTSWSKPGRNNLELLLLIGVLAYGAATVTYLVSLWTDRPSVATSGNLLFRTALVYWAGLMIYLGVPHVYGAGIRPWLWTSAWGLGVVYSLLQRRYSLSALGSFVAALSTLLSTLALAATESGGPLVEGSLAGWFLRTHIALAFLGVIAFAFASAVSVVYLIEARMLKQKRRITPKHRLPPLELLDRLALRSILIGFPFYTIALLMGSAQAMRLGSTDLKVSYVVALLSWCVYGVVLQARLTAGWRGRRAATLTLIGLFGIILVLVQYSMGNA